MYFDTLSVLPSWRQTETKKEILETHIDNVKCNVHNLGDRQRQSKECILTLAILETHIDNVKCNVM